MAFFVRQKIFAKSVALQRVNRKFNKSAGNFKAAHRTSFESPIERQTLITLGY